MDSRNEKVIRISVTPKQQYQEQGLEDRPKKSSGTEPNKSKESKYLKPLSLVKESESATETQTSKHTNAASVGVGASVNESPNRPPRPGQVTELASSQGKGDVGGPSNISGIRTLTRSIGRMSKNMTGTRNEYSFVENTPMHWLTCHFINNSALELEFHKHYYHRYVKHVRFWMSSVPMISALFYGLFYAAYFEKISDSTQYIAISIACTLIPLIVALGTFFGNVENRVLQYLFDLSLLSNFIGIILVDAVYNQHNQDNYLNYCERQAVEDMCPVDYEQVIYRIQDQDSFAFMTFALVLLSGLLNPIFRLPCIHVAGVLTSISVSFMITTIATENYSTALRAASFMCLIYLSSGFFTYAAWQSERAHRRNFLFEKDLARKNSSLRERLDRLISAKKKAVDLDSPIEKAMEILRKWRDHTELNELVGTDVDTLIGILSIPDLFSPDFKKQIKQNELEVDADIQNWIMYEFVKTTNTRTSAHRSVSFGSLVEDGRQSTSAFKILALPGNQEKAEQIVAACEWNADIFTLNEITGGHPLMFATLYIMKKLNLIALFKIPEVKLINFLKEVESGYPDNPFHNRIHAADVTMNMNYMMHRPKVIDCLSDLDKLACVIAACSHDFRHPGFNNAFHIAMEKPEAITYNDKSVLENFHLAQTFHLLLDPAKDCNILSGFSKQDKKELRETIIEMVLATDMANHFGIMGQFKSQLQSDFNPAERASKLLMLRVAMKCCDIGHTTKKQELHRNWTVRVSEEFFLQGDKERENNIPISPFMDRTKEKIFKSQLGFLDFVCKPLFEAWSGFSNEDKDMVTTLEQNHADWKQEAEREALKGAN